MIKLHIVQAEYGDCLLLENIRNKKSTNVLIDGGPYQTFEKHLKPTLQKLPRTYTLDLVVLSHIDNDHIIGLLDLFEYIKNQRELEKKDIVKISKLWHNSFSDLFQISKDPIKLLNNSFQTYPISSNEEKRKIDMTVASIIMKGFQQASNLSSLAYSLAIPINPEFDKLVLIDDKPKSVKLNNITLRILGPTKRNLDKLRSDWKKWIDKKKSNQMMQFELFQIMDKSIPNLSSIMLLVESDNRKILFTGDGSADDLVNILTRNDMLDKDGTFQVDVLKVPHHGSDRNASPQFFNIVIAEYYVISANGRDDNPSIGTLKWIIESKNKNKIRKKIVLTNMTTNMEKILRQYDPIKFNYECIVLDKKSDYLTINVG